MSNLIVLDAAPEFVLTDDGRLVANREGEGASHPRTDQDYLYMTAAHEAGHAVGFFIAAEELGLGNVVLGLKLDKSGHGYLINFDGVMMKGCRGLCQTSREWIDQLRDVGTPENKMRLASAGEAHIIAIFAGGYAEAEMRRRAGSGCDFMDLRLDRIACLDDLREVDKASKRLPSLPYSVWQRRAHYALQLDALKLVQENMKAIDAIATELLVKGELTGQAAFEIFNRNSSTAPRSLAA